MARQLLHSLFALATLSTVQAYFLVGNRDVLVSERLDPILSPNTVSGHAHSVVGGSNFGMNLTTALLRNSECTTMPIQEDRSSYWYPHLYFQHKNGSFSSLTVGNVIYYLFNDAPAGQPNTVKAFPDDFRMISGDMTLRSYDPSSYAQQAVTFLCLDFNGKTTTYNSLPPVACPSGIRAQINFPMCWDGKNVDSPDHKSHVAFPSGGADKGTCNDPKYPITLPRIFIEGYWASQDWDALRATDALNPNQPYVFAHGDPTGYGYHADFFNGWKSGTLQNVLDKCACTSAGFGDAQCCADQGVFTLETSGSCQLTPIVDEQVLGTMSKLPGNNPVRSGPAAAPALAASSMPAILGPAYAYTGASPSATPSVVSTAQGASATPTAAPVSSSSSNAASTSLSSAPASVPVSSSSPSAASVSVSSNSASATPVPPPGLSHSSNAGFASSSSGIATGSIAVGAPKPSASSTSSSSNVATSTSSSSSQEASPPPGSASSVSPSTGATQSASSSGSASSSSSQEASPPPATPSNSTGSGQSASSSGSTSSSSSQEASPPPATPSNSTGSGQSASSSGSTSPSSQEASPSPATPSSAWPSTGSGQSASSSGDDDDGYEMVCERRPKRKNAHHVHRDISKARRHHNAHKRLSSDAF